jgi:toxin YoeB
MKLTFGDEAWEDYLFWSTTDKQVLKKVHALIKDIKRSPFDGIGKPEPLKHEWTGWWSRRIDETHRMIYRQLEDGMIELAKMRGHY